MKLNLFQFVMFVFVATWVLGEVAQATYEEKLYWSVVSSLIIAYLNNAHWILWHKLKRH